MPEGDNPFSGQLSTADALLLIRKRLLDLTTKNRLLSFRWTRGRVVRAVHTGLDDLYDYLKSGRSLVFRPVPEPRKEDYETVGPDRRKPEAVQCAKRQGIDVSYELPPTGEGILRHIQTLLYPEDLERILRNIDRAARTAIEESGTNMLYLVFGFMAWYESDDAQEPRYAPLLTMPVMLKRIRYDHAFLYEITHTGEEIVDNLTLREKLRQDFSLDLPSFDEEDTPSTYFGKVAQLAGTKVQPPWHVSRQVSLGLLSFGNLLMYLDLDPTRWPTEKAIDQNKLVKSLFEGTDRHEEAGGEVFEYAVEEDPRAVRLPLVFDADSSQHSAIVDAMDGKDLVVEGPPGTGKSQTISNLIAAALTDGKTVLFVSEKLAALEVVRDRLDRAGLGVFCLELHSHKTQKQKILEDIKARLLAQWSFPVARELDAKQRELEDRRLRLKRYADLMNSVVHNEMELTVHQVLWAAERQRRALGTKAALFSAEEYPSARTCGYTEHERLKEAAKQLAEHCVAIGGSPQNHAWFGYYPFKLILGDEPALTRVVQRLAEAADALGAEYAQSHERLGFDLPPTRRAFTSLYGQVVSVPSPSGAEAVELLPRICGEDGIEIVREFERQVRHVLQRMPTLQRMLVASDRLEEADLNLATKALEEAGKLNQADTPHPDIQRHAHALQDLAAEIRQACVFFAEVAQRLGVEVVPTRQGLAALWATMNAARAAPLDLLPYRRPQLAEPTATIALERATQRAATVRNRREAVEALFDTSLLPPRDELATALRAMRTSAGLLRTLRPEWRKAARTYRGVRLVRSWVLRAAQCEVELHSLVTYLDDKTLFNGDTELQELLGGLFQGIDTDFALVSRLTDWYAHARKAFERVGGSVDFTLFLGLPADIIEWLAAMAQEGERHWQAAETLQERVWAALEDTGVPLAFSSNEPTFTDLTEVLEIATGTLKEISSVLGSYLAAPASPRELVTLIKEVLSVTGMRREIEHAEAARALLGEHFQGLETDFAPIHAVINWSQAIRCAGLSVQIETWLLRPVPGSLLALRSALEAAEAKWRAVDAATLEFGRFGMLNWEAWQRGYSEDATGIGERTRRALADSVGLWTWAAFSRALYRAEELGLSMLTTPVLNGQLAGSEVSPAFGFLFFNSIARAILRENPALIEFSGLSHEQLRQAFSELDKEVIRLNGKHCANVIDRVKTAPKGRGSGSPKSYTEMALITNEIHKKRGHIPIRQLVNRAGEALQALKPCFMMGPLSVAQYLEPGKLHFDIIIMDEASQIRPEEAIGALARGGQMVIVGDPKQLPPTSFFERFWEGADGEEAEETAAGGMESILDMCRARHRRQLCWHYRSQHEALIHFSNEHFYRSRLIVFPSPYGVQTGLGLRHHYVSKGLYENRRNLEEARRVADAVIYHFLNHLGESLGVATLNLPQRDLIEEEIDRRLRVNPQAEKYIEKWKNEGLMPFFVKNLENVQGDERDVIFISTTYGRSRAGVVAQRFGPINQPDGWRRLNVLFTRARKRVELFTSMQPSDIVVDVKSSEGVRALRDYLAYVRDGILEGPKEGGREPDSDFEIAVAEVLQNAGYEVVPQLGVAGFFIDIAVRNPARPGEYIAAIECDGATYHSARSVRDRDRIRQEILEGLGWKDRIYRIWSTDWFRDPNAQIKRLLAFLESAWERAEAKATPQVERQPIEMLRLPFLEEASTVETFCVKVGDWVTYYDPKYPSDKKRVRIVNGASDPSGNFVGSQTPLAKAMLGAGIGDESELIIEGQPPRTLKILDID